MPLIRVSDQVHEHLKQLGQDQKLSVDAVLRQALSLDGARKTREYINRGGLMPLEVYRWLILAAFPSAEGSSSDNPVPQTRRMLMNHLEETLDDDAFREVWPNDFTYTPNPKGRRLRWKMRFTNVLREMIHTGSLVTSPSNESEYMVNDDVMRNFLRIGLHLDNTNEDDNDMADGWWFTKLPEAVNMDNWEDYHTLTINQERHNPLMVDDDYAEWLDMASFIWGQQKYSSLKSMARTDNIPESWIPPGGNPKLMVSIITNSGIKGILTHEEWRNAQGTFKDVKDLIELAVDSVTTKLEEPSSP